MLSFPTIRTEDTKVRWRTGAIRSDARKRQSDELLVPVVAVAVQNVHHIRIFTASISVKHM